MRVLEPWATAAATPDYLYVLPRMRHSLARDTIRSNRHLLPSTAVELLPYT